MRRGNRFEHCRCRRVDAERARRIQDALERNQQREGAARIPDKGVLGRAAQLELPTMAEGFDELWYVRMDGNGSFVIEEWNNAL